MLEKDQLPKELLKKNNQKQVMSMITLLFVEEKKVKKHYIYTTKNNMLYKFGTYQKEHPGKATLRMQNKM